MTIKCQEKSWEESVHEEKVTNVSIRSEHVLGNAFDNAYARNTVKEDMEEKETR